MFTKLKTHSLKTILCGYAILACSQALALESDRSAEIHIEADTVNLDQGKGIAIYSGNVSFKQGTINIVAENIEVYAKNGQLDRAKIQGGNKLARFEQETQPGQTMSGEANFISVQQSSSEVVFEGNATVNDGLNTISGGLIRYNSKQHKIIADKGDKESGRVKMIFLPATVDQNLDQEKQ